MRGKRVLVTAASRGIGWASAVRMASEGARVCISAPACELINSSERLEDCRTRGMDIYAVEFDAFNKASYNTMFASAVKILGGLDVLVNNFGYTIPKLDQDIFHIDYNDYEKFVNVNLASVIIPIQLALPVMAAGGGGSIINIASIGGKVPDMTEMAYGSAKAAICHITKMVASQAAPVKVRCNAVLPGLTMTDAVKNALTDEYRTFFLRHVPLGRGAEPEEIASAVRFFASDDSSFVTGQLLDVAGGFGTATPLYADMMEMAVKMQA